jgi:hypothetical protein
MLGLKVKQRANRAGAFTGINSLRERYFAGAKTFEPHHWWLVTGKAATEAEKKEK